MSKSFNQIGRSLSVHAYKDDVFGQAALVVLLQQRLIRILPKFLRRAKKFGLAHVSIRNDSVFFSDDLGPKAAFRLAKLLGGAWRERRDLKWSINSVVLVAPPEVYMPIVGRYEL